MRATNRKNGDPSEKIIPIDRLAEIAPKVIIDRHRIVDSGRIITAGGISSGLEMGFYLLERFGYDKKFVATVAHIKTIQELGVRLAGLAPRSSGTLKERLRNTVSFLESLGSVVDVTEKKGKVVINGYGCPITGAVEADGRLCIAMAVMISKLVGTPATERCNRDDQPGCCFEIKLP